MQKPLDSRFHGNDWKTQSRVPMHFGSRLTRQLSNPADKSSFVMYFSTESDFLILRRQKFLPRTANPSEMPVGRLWRSVRFASGVQASAEP